MDLTESESPVADLVLALRDPSLANVDGTRRASARAELVYHPPGSRRPVRSVSFLFTAPLGPIEKEELGWYLERYPYWPTGVFRERARQVEDQLPVWGRRIHDALDVRETRDVLAAWHQADARLPRRFTVHVGGSWKARGEVSKAASWLLALPWELAHDGRAYLFHDVLVRRRWGRPEPADSVVVETPIRVLLVSPRPEERYIDHRVCAAPLVDAFEPSSAAAELTLLRPPTIRNLRDELRRARQDGLPYHVVHFDGHGAYDPELGGVLDFEDGDPLLPAAISLRAEAFAKLLRDNRVPLVFLQACQSAKTEDDPTASVAGRLLQHGVGSVLAMTHNVLVETARRFVGSFYRQLVQGASVGESVLAARNALREDDFRIDVFRHPVRLQDWFVPVLFQAGGDPVLVRALPRETKPQDPVERAFGRIPAAPGHSFVGRSRELLKAERLLARESYVVLRGEGGEGKTTAELARWLVRTHRFGRVAFVALDHHPDARAALFELGDQLLPDFVSRASRDLRQARSDLNDDLAATPTLLVFDNVETVLEFEDAKEEVLSLARELMSGGKAHLVFTTRQPLPAPFARHHLDVSRLSRHDAAVLVARVLDRDGAVPLANDEGENEDEIVQLVDAVRGHARSLVLLAREVAAAGVRRTTADLRGLMRRLHERYPDDRERSLLASVELSLRRLPAGMRERIRPLAVFHGGGYLGVIAKVLSLDMEKDEEVTAAQELVNVGLGELLPYGYLRLHPALGPALAGELSDDERHEARRAWVEAMVPFISFLYEKQFQDGQLTASLTVLDLPNLLGVLEHLRDNVPFEQAVPIVAALEALLKDLGRPKVTARAVRWREEASQELGEWSKAAFEAESAKVDRLLDKGRIAEAARTARNLLVRCLEMGEDAYDGASYDIAMTQFRLCRAMEAGGDSEAALTLLAEAVSRFQKLGHEGDDNALRMARKCLTEAGDCHRAAGRFEQARAFYEKSIQLAGELNDERGAAVARAQLGSVFMLQKKFQEAINVLRKARDALEELGELANVAAVWHHLGRIYQSSEEYATAEDAYQRALKIHVQSGNSPGEAKALHQLGRVYGLMERREEALRFYRQAAELDGQMGNSSEEAIVRTNAADELIQLRRFDEARQEILRAIECERQPGGATERWTTFAVLHQLEKGVGDEVAASAARAKAVEAFLAYRRVGGENHEPSGKLAEMAREALASGRPEELASRLTEALESPEVPRERRLYVTALLDVLAGSRDPALASNPELQYSEAVELVLLLEALTSADGTPWRPEDP